VAYPAILAPYTLCSLAACRPTKPVRCHRT